jgi:hypothetical protein
MRFLKDSSLTGIVDSVPYSHTSKNILHRITHNGAKLEIVEVSSVRKDDNKLNYFDAIIIVGKFAGAKSGGLYGADISEDWYRREETVEVEDMPVLLVTVDNVFNTMVREDVMLAIDYVVQGLRANLSEGWNPPRDVLWLYGLPKRLRPAEGPLLQQPNPTHPARQWWLANRTSPVPVQVDAPMPTQPRKRKLKPAA